MLILFVLLIVMPLAEIAAFIQIGSLIGLWPTLLAVVATAVIGGFLLRQQGLRTLHKARAELAQNRMPMRSLFDGLCLFAAGLVLLTPGFITDAIGFLLLLPPVRKMIADRLLHHLEKRADLSVTISGEWQGGPGEPDGSPPRRRPDREPEPEPDPEPSPEERAARADEDQKVAPDPNLPPVDRSRWGRKGETGDGTGTLED
ncbi:MAG: FxsA family protein [Alphaproteobacteria bacterium]|jgi:UPF0716 protein FxsA|nr:FxsA family protein [Alphaproteobacteria bacterium]